MRGVFGLAAIALACGIGAGVGRADDHKGPHGGMIVELGDEEYHAEIVVDQKAGSALVYIYGSHSDLHNKKLKAVDSKRLTMVLKSTSPSTTIKFEPDPAKDDPTGSSSKFKAKHDAFKSDGKFTGTLSCKIGPKPYSGDFK